MVQNDKLKQFQENVLKHYNVELSFHPDVDKDLKKHRGHLSLIFQLILRRAKQGALFKPEGVAEPLNSPLHNYAKIKHKSSGIRIIYLAVKEDPIKMKIIAIGPRDKMKAYKRAEERL